MGATNHKHQAMEEEKDPLSTQIKRHFPPSPQPPFSSPNPVSSAFPWLPYQVLKIIKKVKRPLHVSSRKQYSPKVIMTSRRNKGTRRTNSFQPLP
ncbi:hypothetical protein MC885_005553 [Smutsia gigantea]|nr:hypothetical protein MC885_005553 [Smutsia gigantea]